MQTATISLILVNYNSFTDIKTFIKSFLPIQEKIRMKVYIYNNDDNEREQIDNFFSQCGIPLFIYHSKNIGFGAAVNFMAKVIDTEYMLIVNPDCILIDSAFDKFINEYLSLRSNLNVGFFAPTLVDENKIVDICYGEFPTLTEVFFRTFFLHRIFRTYYENKLSIGKSFVKNVTDCVPYPCGAFLLIERNLFLRFGGFNKRYFAYFEETDLSLILEQNNYRNYITPSYKVVHKRGNRTIGAVNNRYFIKSQYMYFKSHDKSIFILLILNLIGILIRFPLYGFKIAYTQILTNLKSFKDAYKSK